MKKSHSLPHIRAVLIVLAAVLLGGANAVLGTCGPFTDVAGDGFCAFVLEIFDLGITTGTTPTTYSPDNVVTRLQMAAFLARTVDRVLQRGSGRAALGQFWTPQSSSSLGLTTVGAFPTGVKSDGADLWVANISDNTVSRVRASDGKLLETWTGAANSRAVLVTEDRILVTGATVPGRLYRIDPSQTAGAVTTVASNLTSGSSAIAYDGARVWTAHGSGGAVSIVTPGATIPWSFSTVATGFVDPFGLLYDGTNIWVTDQVQGFLLKLNGVGSILQTVTIGSGAHYPAFDGSSIWAPSSSGVSVVRASSGAVLATLTGNGLGNPLSAAFDGQRILVTNSVGNSVSLWKAADLTPLGFFSTGAAAPFGVCSDGIQFWITLSTNHLARF